METESEDEGSQRKSRLLRSCYPPYLRLHEGKEYEERLREEQGERSNAVDDRYAQYWRFYRIHRFFDSIIGFHEGSLDLSGRHYPRYQKLISRWDDYLVDFRIIEPSAKKVYTDHTFRGESWQEIEYEFLDTEKWDSFRTKWHLPPGIAVSLFRRTERTIKTLESSPTPKIQKLCLFHLPVEVLQIIYQIARLNDARTLSSASKRMREIGEPFIFGSRVLNMDVPRERLSTIREEAGAREPEFLVAFQELANGARQAYLGKVDFLLSREDILRKLNKLSLINVWNERRYEIKYIAGGHMPTKQDPSFFDLIHGRNSSVLHHAAHITQLKIEGLQIPIDYLNPIHGFQALHSVEIRSCSVQDSIINAIRQARYPPITAIINLRMVMEQEGSWDIVGPHLMWYLLPLFVNVKNLCIEWIQGSHDTMPPLEVLAACNPFLTLEKFTISQTNASEVPVLVNWIQAAFRPDEPLGLTHFKIRTRDPVNMSVLTTLLAALHLAPRLHTCVFDGLATSDARPSVFATISEHLPDIVGLTIVKYDDMEGRSRRSCDYWPGAMWEYAREFIGFSRLEFFSWNNRFVCEYMPSSIQLMESGYPEKELNENSSLEEDNNEWYDIFRYDSERIAALWAVYCPTLQTIVHTANRMCPWGSRIIHRDGKKFFEPIRAGGLQITEKWNTDGMFGQGEWSKILPDRQRI